MLLEEVQPGHVMNSTDHEGTNTGPGFGDNISSVVRVEDVPGESNRPVSTQQPQPQVSTNDRKLQKF